MDTAVPLELHNGDVCLLSSASRQYLQKRRKMFRSLLESILKLCGSFQWHLINIEVIAHLNDWPPSSVIRSCRGDVSLIIFHVVFDDIFARLIVYLLSLFWGVGNEQQAFLSPVGRLIDTF